MRSSPATWSSPTRWPAASVSCLSSWSRPGATLIGTAGSAEKVALGLDLGADHVIDYLELSDLGELPDRVEELTGGQGVHVVYDGVGRTTFDASLASLRPRGMMVLYGGAMGRFRPFDIQRLNRGGSLFLTRPTMSHYIATREELACAPPRSLAPWQTGR